jgi:hypothetical protein
LSTSTVTPRMTTPFLWTATRTSSQRRRRPRPAASSIGCSGPLARTLVDRQAINTFAFPFVIIIKASSSEHSWDMADATPTGWGRNRYFMNVFGIITWHICIALRRRFGVIMVAFLQDQHFGPARPSNIHCGSSDSRVFRLRKTNNEVAVRTLRCLTCFSDALRDIQPTRIPGSEARPLTAVF